MSLQDLCEAIEGECPKSAAEVRVNSLTTDTRTLRPGDLFLALDGENFRGADYSDAAFRAGAVAVVAVMDREAAEAAPGPVIRIRDGAAALWALAQHVRARLSAKVVAITGSVGKTTTKDALAVLLSGQFKVVASPASFNNRIGVPLTILAADENTEILVLEIGASLKGEIARLAGLAEPDVAVVTAVADAHLEGFGDLETIRVEKLSIGQNLPVNGMFLINGDDANLAAASFENMPPQRYGFGEGMEHQGFAVSSAKAAPAFRMSPQGPVIESELIGEYNQQNLLAAATVASYFGLTEDQVAKAASGIKAPRWRMESHVLGGAEILLDCYNANPRSMRAALKTLASRECQGRRIAILGDMGELGLGAADQHQDLAKSMGPKGLDCVLLVGPLMAAAASSFAAAAPATKFEMGSDATSAGQWLRKQLRPGDLVMVKGSRSMRLERVIDGLAEKWEGGASV